MNSGGADNFKAPSIVSSEKSLISTSKNVFDANRPDGTISAIQSNNINKDLEPNTPYNSKELSTSDNERRRRKEAPVKIQENESKIQFNEKSLSKEAEKPKSDKSGLNLARHQGDLNDIDQNSNTNKLNINLSNSGSNKSSIFSNSRIIKNGRTQNKPSGNELSFSSLKISNGDSNSNSTQSILSNDKVGQGLDQKISNHSLRDFEKDNMNKKEEPKTWQEVAKMEENLINASTHSDSEYKAYIDTKKDESLDFLQDIKDPLGIYNTREELDKTVKLSHYDDGKLDPMDRRFDPDLYLEIVHANTTWENLLKGRKNLELKASSRQKQLEFMVKDNFSCFMNCKDAIGGIYSKIETENRSESIEIRENLEELYTDLYKESQGVFSSLLDSQYQAERIRSQLNILKRSQFIFNLPQQMRDNIQKEEYGKVVLNYKKFKSLIIRASHASIKNVVNEVNGIIKELRLTLFKKIEKSSLNFTHQETLIKYLVDLDSPIDPTRKAINIMYEGMKALLSIKPTEELPEYTDQTVDNSGNKNIATNQDILNNFKDYKVSKDRSGNNSDSNNFKINTNRNKNSEISSIEPLEMDTYVVIKFLNENLPLFWKMCQNYLNNTYHFSTDEKKDPNKPSKKMDVTNMVYDIEKIASNLILKDIYGPSITIESAVNLDIRSWDIFSEKRHIKGSLAESQTKSKDENDITFQAYYEKPLIFTQENLKFNSLDNKFIGKGPESKFTGDISGFRLYKLEENEKPKLQALIKLLQDLVQIIPLENLQILFDTLDIITRNYVLKTFDIIEQGSLTWLDLENWRIGNHQEMITNLPRRIEVLLTKAMTGLNGVIFPEDPLIIYVQKTFVEYTLKFMDAIHELSFRKQNSSIRNSNFSKKKNKFDDSDSKRINDLCTRSDHRHSNLSENRIKKANEIIHSSSSNINKLENESYINYSLNLSQGNIFSVKNHRFNSIYNDRMKRGLDFSSGSVDLSSDALLHLKSEPFINKNFTYSNRLILMYNACNYTKNVIIPKLEDIFISNFGRPLFMGEDVNQLKLINYLQEKIIRRYVLDKTVKINNILHKGLLRNEYDWNIQIVLPQIRDYLPKTLLELVLVHNELYQFNQKLLDIVITQLVENIYQYVLDAFNLIEKISNHTGLQVGMELNFFSKVMYKYRSPEVVDLYNQIDNFFQYSNLLNSTTNQISPSDKKAIQDYTERFLSATTLLFNCFVGIGNK